ncbi:MAG: dTMP kinase [Natronosporangium sp.]
MEGPHGVGKSTIATLLALRLAVTAPVHLTAEPTDTPLGRLLRREEWTLSGRSLALAVAGDRYAHIDEEIIPQLNAGRHVVTDGYVQSSLVAGGLDGMELAEAWRYNAFVLPPTVTFYLRDDPQVIAQRRAARPALSRLELTGGGPKRELDLYEKVRRFLHRQQWRRGYRLSAPRSGRDRDGDPGSARRPDRCGQLTAARWRACVRGRARVFGAGEHLAPWLGSPGRVAGRCCHPGGLVSPIVTVRMSPLADTGVHVLGSDASPRRGVNPSREATTVMPTAATRRARSGASTVRRDAGECDRRRSGWAAGEDREAMGS